MRGMYYDIFLNEAGVQGGEGPSAPGTGEPTEATDEPAAEPTTPESASSGPPESIPYPRFKEVNDALKPFKELEKAGYGPDELRRLVEWEAAYSENPEQAWLSLAAGLDLPPEIKEQVTAYLSGEGSGQPPASAQPNASEGEPGSEEPPEWAKPLLEDHQTRREREAQAASNAILDGILTSWDEADKEDKLVIPEDMKEQYQSMRLSLIAGNARGANTPEEILQRARSETLAFRELVLKSAVSGRSGSPQSVPGGEGASMPGEPPTVPKTLEEAAIIAQKRLEAAAEAE